MCLAAALPSESPTEWTGYRSRVLLSTTVLASSAGSNPLAHNSPPCLGAAGERWRISPYESLWCRCTPCRPLSFGLRNDPAGFGCMAPRTTYSSVLQSGR